MTDFLPLDAPAKTDSLLMTLTEVCEELRISRVTFWRVSKKDPTAPRAVHLYDTVKRWRRDDIETWIASRPKDA